MGGEIREDSGFMKIYKITTKDYQVIYQEGTSNSSAIYKLQQRLNIPFCKVKEVRRLTDQEVNIYKEWMQNRNID